jgi:DNA-binding LacI/PurR family transcriptional regulator
MTIYDIAKEAGVSPATVSRVLTGSAGVSEVKRTAVDRLIKKYEFRPNAAARSLHRGVNILGIMAEDIRNPYNAALEVECEKAANKLGYTILLCNVLDDAEVFKANLENFYAQRVGAIIQIMGILDRLVSTARYRDTLIRVAKTIPLISTGECQNFPQKAKGFYSLRIDEAIGMRLVLDYLISLGHRKIAYIGHNTLPENDTHERYLEFTRYHTASGMRLRKEYIATNEVGNNDDIFRILRDKNRPSAIVVISDYTAVQVTAAIRGVGLSIPQDISLVSFDNTFIAEAMYPKLTSVEYDYQEFGRLLVENAIAASEGSKLPKVRFIAPRLIVRDSCAPPPAVNTGGPRT